jgi:ribosomal protein L32
MQFFQFASAQRFCFNLHRSEKIDPSKRCSVMTKFNQCPNCGKLPKGGFVFGDSGVMNIYECECGTLYCYQCGDQRCPNCGSKKRKEAGKCYKPKG